MANEVKATPTFDELTPRQRAFVTHPLVLTDPIAAAEAVGYDKNFAQHRASAMRREFAAYIARAETAQLIRAAVTPQQVGAELQALAFANVLDYFEVWDTEKGSHVSLKQNLKTLPAEIQRCIKKLEFESVVLPDGSSYQAVTKLELHDRTWALKELIDILRVRERPNEKDDTSKLLEHMSADDLQAVEDAFTRAARRAEQAKSAVKDKNAVKPAD